MSIIKITQKEINRAKILTKPIKPTTQNYLQFEIKDNYPYIRTNMSSTKLKMNDAVRLAKWILK